MQRMIPIYETLTDAQRILNTLEITKKRAGELAALCEKLTDKTLTLAVIGQFKRGKSSLINAILGEGILPVGIIPVTSTAVRIMYGERSAEISFLSGEHRIVQFTELPEYISEQKNRDNVRGVSSVTVHLPSPLLKNGLTLVDTPGVGSIHTHNTHAAYQFVQESDAVIFMLSVDSPLNEIELAFLQEAKEHAAKFYFAVNKIDTIPASDLDEYLAYCRGILTRIFAMQEAALFPVSAKTHAGIDELITAVCYDCSHQGDRILETSVRRKALGVLTSASAEIELFAAALSMPARHLDEIMHALKQKLLTLEKMSRHASILIAESGNDLIDTIEEGIETEKNAVTAEMLRLLREIYEEHSEEKTSRLEEMFQYFLQTTVKERLTCLHETEMAKFKSGYDDLVHQYAHGMEGLKTYLASCVLELFGIRYQSDAGSYAVSDRTDFCLHLDVTTYSFLIDTEHLETLLPKKIANKRLYQRMSKKIEQSISRNLTNMVADYRYQLRDSIRMFESMYGSETRNLTQGLNSTLARAGEEKTRSQEEVAGELAEIQKILGDIAVIRSRLEEGS